MTLNIIKELNRGYEYVVSLWTQSPQPVNISEAVLRLAKVKEAQCEVSGVGEEWGSGCGQWGSGCGR